MPQHSFVYFLSAQDVDLEKLPSVLTWRDSHATAYATAEAAPPDPTVLAMVEVATPDSVARWDSASRRASVWVWSPRRIATPPSPRCTTKLLLLQDASRPWRDRFATSNA